MSGIKLIVALGLVTMLVAGIARAEEIIIEKKSPTDADLVIESDAPTAVSVSSAPASSDAPASPAASAAPAGPTDTEPAPKPDRPYKTVSRTASAEGKSLATAIINALDEAVLQVNGTVIKGDRAIRSKYDASRHAMNSAGDMYDEGAIRAASFGLIETYEVIEQSTDPITGMVTVKLKVEVPQYDDKLWRWGGRRTIAVIPLRDRSELGQPQGQRSFQSSSFIRAMTHGLVTQLAQSNKFIVLDREYSSEWERELDLIASEKTPLADKAKLAQAMGADYLLVGSLEGLEQAAWTEEVKLTGYTKGHQIALASVDYRLLNAATAEVAQAGSVRAILGDAELAQLPQGSSEHRALEPLANDVAFRISSELIESLFPIKVAFVQADGTVVLNQGGRRVALGEKYDIFSQGVEIRDPDTGEVIGREEVRLAQVEIVRIEPRLSRARIIKGSETWIKEGALCRPLSQSPPPPK